MFSTRCMVAADWSGVKHFTPDEFVEHDTGKNCADKMGYEFILWLDGVREEAGVPMVVTSSHRTKAHNVEVGGAEDSAHEDVPCNCVDIGMRPRLDDPNWNLSRYKIVETAIDKGCQRIGTYADGSIHLDMTHDRRPAPRMWRIVDNPAK